MPWYILIYVVLVNNPALQYTYELTSLLHIFTVIIKLGENFLI